MCVFLSICVIDAVGQDVPVENLIPQKVQTQLEYFTFKKIDGTSYGGVVLTTGDGTIFGSSNALSLFTHSNRELNFYTGTGNVIFFPNIDNSNTALRGSGNVGIGTTNPLAKLSVNGKIRATEVKVLAEISVPDYVFNPTYELMTLKETKKYIAEYSHLPEIPSADEIGENGIDLGDMNMRLLKKIEELTLHQIALMEKLEQQQMRIDELEDKIE